MALSGEEVRVPIGIPVETNSRAAAGDVDQLRASIEKSQTAIKDNAQMMRGLRGSSEEVKAARDQLKASIEREKQSLSASTLALIKQGTSLDQLAKQTKKSKDAQKESKEKFDAVGDALTRAHPKLGMFRDGIKSVLETSKQGGSLGLVSLGIAGIAAAAIAATAAVGGLAVALGTWIIKGADAARSMALVRDASTNTAADSKNLGDQVARLGSKVPTSAAALNDLAASLARTRLDGKVAVDALNAVAQANAAVGDSAGAKIRDIIERGRLVNRMMIGWQELNGTGLDIGDVAGALAKKMGVSVKDAQKALAEGRVTLADGAAAMRGAVEKKFGAINLKKMMSLDGLSETFSKITSALTRDIDLEPAAKAVASFFHAFDQSTETGIAMKKLSTDFGNGIVKLLVQGTPLAKDFLEELVVGGLKADTAFTKLHIAALDLEYAIKKPLKDVGLLDAFNRVEGKTGSFLLTLNPVLGQLSLVEMGFKQVAAPVQILADGLTKLENGFKSLEKFASKGVGGAIVDGIVGGMKDSEGKVKGGAASIASIIQKAFRGELQINSPSRVMRKDTHFVGDGIIQGVEDKKPEVQQAIADMSRPPKFALPAAGGSSGGGSSASSAPTAHINVAAGAFVLHAADAEGAKEAMSSPGLLQAVTQLFKDSAAAAGLTVGTIEVGT